MSARIQAIGCYLTVERMLPTLRVVLIGVLALELSAAVYLR